jgi:hypothetical protein
VPAAAIVPDAGARGGAPVPINAAKMPDAGRPVVALKPDAGRPAAPPVASVASSKPAPHIVHNTPPPPPIPVASSKPKLKPVVSSSDDDDGFGTRK